MLVVFFYCTTVYDYIINIDDNKSSPNEGLQNFIH